MSTYEVLKRDQIPVLRGVFGQMRVTRCRYEDMSAVSDAWIRYAAVATELGADFVATIEPAGSRSQVADAFADAGMDPTDDLIDYFELLFHIEEPGRVFWTATTLDLAGAIAERHELTEFAATNAAENDGDPEDLYPARFFPLTKGKPTTSVDRGDGRVYDQWWDELDARLVAESLAEWLDQRTTELQTEGDADTAQVGHFFNPATRPGPRRVAEKKLSPGEVWMVADNAIDHFMAESLAEGRMLVVRHAPIGSVPGHESLELVQAQTMVKLLLELGAPPDQIVLEATTGDGVIQKARRADVYLHIITVQGEHGHSA